MCNRAADGIMVCCSLTAPQCWRGQNGCVYCSWPPHSARQRSRFCGYLWSGGWAAQREDVYGTESGEFTSKWNWCILFPWLNFTTRSESTTLEKKKKERVSSCISSQVVSVAVYLSYFLLCALLWSHPHEEIPKGTIWQCIKSISRAGFPLLKTAGTCPEITRFSHYFSVCRDPLCRGLVLLLSITVLLFLNVLYVSLCPHFGSQVRACSVCSLREQWRRDSVRQRCSVCQTASY